jgi:hypothetical protein
MPLLINLLYLIKLNLLPDFIDLTLNFNRLYYLNNGFKYPEISSIIQIFIIVLPFYFIKLKNKLLIFITTFLFSFLVFPRFEYFHLLPAITILIFLTGISVKLNNQKIIYLILFLLIILNFRKLIHYSQGNYYFDDKTLATVEYLKNISGNTIYILGGNDLIYPLSQKIPPGYTYVPSLPWYLNVPKYQDKLIKALVRSPYTLILVNAEANVDNLAIVSPDMELMKFIKKNYTPFEKVGPYQVYKHKLFGNLEQ